MPVGSTWQWLHPTDDTDPATADADFHTTFFNLDYDDSHWQSGKDSAGAEGGFGYGDPVGVDIGQPGPANRKTAYFRHTFKSDAAFDILVISMQWDDGVIIYLDGVEVGRDNVGPGAEAYDLYAVKNNWRSETVETAVRHILLSGMLAAGEHVLAISLHNRPPGSSDLRIAEISLAGRRVGSEPGE